MTSVHTTSAPDLLIVGGGVVGLWCARLAIKAGMRVTLVERHRLGAGASGGVVGALIPNQPTNWNPKKQFQLDALVSLEPAIEALEAETGLRAGYRRVGRIMPLDDETRMARMMAWANLAAPHWPDRYRWTVGNAPDLPGWLDADAAPHGVSMDTLSARLAPRALIGALAASISAKATVLEGIAVAGIGADGVQLTDGSVIGARTVILAAGVDTFDLARPLGIDIEGDGVRGEAALLRPTRPVDPALPVIHDGSLYVIAHDDGTIALGSTSAPASEPAAGSADRLDAVIAAAVRVCPALRSADIVERWSGVRPRAATRSPVIGPLPESDSVIVATAGYKISFGIAHEMAALAVACAAGGKPEIIKGFLPDAARRKS